MQIDERRHQNYISIYISPHTRMRDQWHAVQTQNWCYENAITPHFHYFHFELVSSIRLKYDAPFNKTLTVMHGSKKEIAFQLTTETRYAACSTPYRSITYVPSSKSTLYSISSPPTNGVITRAPNKKKCQKWMVIAYLACAQARSQLSKKVRQ